MIYNPMSCVPYADFYVFNDKLMIVNEHINHFPHDISLSAVYMMDNKGDYCLQLCHRTIIFKNKCIGQNIFDKFLIPLLK